MAVTDIFVVRGEGLPPLGCRRAVLAKGGGSLSLLGSDGVPFSVWYSSSPEETAAVTGVIFTGTEFVLQRDPNTPSITRVYLEEGTDASSEDRILLSKSGGILCIERSATTSTATQPESTEVEDDQPFIAVSLTAGELDVATDRFLNALAADGSTVWSADAWIVNFITTCLSCRFLDDKIVSRVNNFFKLVIDKLCLAVASSTTRGKSLSTVLDLLCILLCPPKETQLCYYSQYGVGEEEDFLSASDFQTDGFFVPPPPREQPGGIFRLENLATFGLGFAIPAGLEAAGRSLGIGGGSSSSSSSSGNNKVGGNQVSKLLLTNLNHFGKGGGWDGLISLLEHTDSSRRISIPQALLCVKILRSASNLANQDFALIYHMFAHRNFHGRLLALDQEDFDFLTSNFDAIDKGLLEVDAMTAKGGTVEISFLNESREFLRLKIGKNLMLSQHSGMRARGVHLLAELADLSCRTSTADALGGLMSILPIESQQQQQTASGSQWLNPERFQDFLVSENILPLILGNVQESDDPLSSVAAVRHLHHDLLRNSTGLLQFAARSGVLTSRQIEVLVQASAAVRGSSTSFVVESGVAKLSLRILERLVTLVATSKVACLCQFVANFWAPIASKLENDHLAVLSKLIPRSMDETCAVDDHCIFSTIDVLWLASIDARGSAEASNYLLEVFLLTSPATSGRIMSRYLDRLISSLEDPNLVLDTKNASFALLIMIAKDVPSKVSSEQRSRLLSYSVASLEEDFGRSSSAGQSLTCLQIRMRLLHHAYSSTTTNKAVQYVLQNPWQHLQRQSLAPRYEAARGHILTLWNCCVNDETDPTVSDSFFQWMTEILPLSDASSNDLELIDVDTAKLLFYQLDSGPSVKVPVNIRPMRTSNFRPAEAEFLQRLFLVVNKDSKCIAGTVKTVHLEKVGLLIDVVKKSTDACVQEQTASFISGLFAKLDQITVDRRKAWITLTVQFLQQLSESYESKDVTACRGLLILLANFFQAISKSLRPESKENEIDMTVFLTAAAEQELDADKKQNFGNNRSQKYTFETSSSIGSIRSRLAKDSSVSPLSVLLKDANGITLAFSEDDDFIATHPGLRVIDAFVHNKALIDPNSTGYRTHLPAKQPFEELSSDQVAPALLVSSNWQAMVMVNQLLCGESVEVSEQAWHVLKLVPLQPESSAQLSIGYGSDWTACFGLGVAGFSLRLLRPLIHSLEVTQNLEERRFLQWCTSFVKTGGFAYLIDTLETITQQDLSKRGKESLGLLTVFSLFQLLLRIISSPDMLEMAKNAVSAPRVLQALRCSLRISLFVCSDGTEADSSSTKECKVQIVRSCFHCLSLKSLWPEFELEVFTSSSSLDLSAALTTAPLELRQTMCKELVSLSKDRGAMFSKSIFELLRPAFEATSCESPQLFTLVLSLIDAFSEQDKSATASTLLASIAKKLDVIAEETHEEIGSTVLHESLMFMSELTLRVSNCSIPLEPAFARKLFGLLFEKSPLSTQPAFKSTSTRKAALNLLTTLCDRNDMIMQDTLTLLSKQHRKVEMEQIQDKIDTAACRSPLGICGISNPGCVCYICSTMQILFAMPALRQAILDITPSHFANAPRSSAQDFEAVKQLQSLFLIMQESDRASADLSLFCKNFLDLDGKPTSLIEQADASEFLLRLLQRVEATLVGLKNASVLQTDLSYEQLQEISADEGKLYSSTKERSFLISVDVGVGSLIQSLESYTSSEVVDYVWEVSDPSKGLTKKLFQTSKTTRFSRLPQHLMFHLKRFTFDLKTFQLSKVHSRFEFPFVLDMFPYTVAAAEERQKGQGASHQCLYELVGVVVHSGQFSSGHYYSFIREEGKNTWLEVNDGWVGRFDATNMEAETFGEDVVRSFEVSSSVTAGFSVVNAFASVLGFDTSAKTAASPASLSKTRSAFILVYNRVSDAVVPRKATIPSFLDAVVREESMRFFRTKYLLSPAYLEFAVRAMSKDLKRDSPPEDDVLQSYLSFFFGTLLQARVCISVSRDELRALVLHLAPLLLASVNGRRKVALWLISTLSECSSALALSFSRLESKEDKAVVGVVNMALVECLEDPASWGAIIAFLSTLYSPAAISDARKKWSTSVSFWEPLLTISSSGMLTRERMAEVQSLCLESALGHFLSDGEMFESAWEGVEKVSRARSHLKRLIQCISNLTDVDSGQIHEGLLRSDKFRERLNRMLVNAKVRENLAALVSVSDPDSFLLKRRVSVRFSGKAAFEGIVREICMDGEDVVYTISFDDGEIKDFRNFPVERIWSLV